MAEHCMNMIKVLISCDVLHFPPYPITGAITMICGAMYNPCSFQGCYCMGPQAQVRLC